MQVADCNGGNIDSSTVVMALDYAHRMGAHIVQMSLGAAINRYFTPSEPAPSYQAEWIKTYATALKPLEEKNVLVVASSGKCPPTCVCICMVPVHNLCTVTLCKRVPILLTHAMVCLDEIYLVTR